MNTNTLSYIRIDIAGLFLLVALLSLIGCKSDLPTQPTPSYKIPTNGYIFIEHTVTVDGVTIEGEYLGPLIDFPMYTFDSSTGVLFGDIEFPVDDTLKSIYGNGLFLTGDAGGGAASEVHGFYRVPSSYYEFTLVKILDSTRATVTYKDSSITLTLGHPWEFISTRLDTVPGGVAKLTTTDRIVNFGLQLKSKIKKWF